MEYAIEPLKKNSPGPRAQNAEGGARSPVVETQKGVSSSSLALVQNSKTVYIQRGHAHTRTVMTAVESEIELLVHKILFKKRAWSPGPKCLRGARSIDIGACVCGWMGM